ncbi:MAG TPA: HEPN domain-containing protein [Pirellulales bacterium]|jgi:HEPN domain-containing protein|nr:HEPN domain-containing protein [Pirellulales bacterium]
MSDRDHARALLEMSRSDLNALRGMQHPSLFGKDFFSDEIFGFHAQQAVEKALKAWLAFKSVRYSHTHDLQALIDAVEDSGEDADWLREMVDLNPFAVQYRYESVDEEEEAIDRTSVLAQARMVFDHVAGAMGEPPSSD